MPRATVAIGILLSLAWFTLCGWYVQRAVGWQNLFDFLPHEVAAVFAAGFAPPAFLWLLLIAVTKPDFSRGRLPKLLTRMEEIVYAPEQGNAQLAQMTEELKAQRRELEAAKAEAREGLEAAAREIAEAVEGLKAASAELRVQADGLGRTEGEIRSRVAESEASLESQKAALSAAAEDGRSAAAEMAETLGKPLADFGAAAREAKHLSEEAARDLTASGEGIASASAKLLESSEALRKAMQDDAERLLEANLELGRNLASLREEAREAIDFIAHHAGRDDLRAAFLALPAVRALVSGKGVEHVATASPNGDREGDG